jgi:hypothetical protein
VPELRRGSSAFGGRRWHVRAYNAGGNVQRARHFDLALRAVTHLPFISGRLVGSNALGPSHETGWRQRGRCRSLECDIGLKSMLKAACYHQGTKTPRKAKIEQKVTEETEAAMRALVLRIKRCSYFNLNPLRLGLTWCLGVLVPLW